MTRVLYKHSQEEKGEKRTPIHSSTKKVSVLFLCFSVFLPWSLSNLREAAWRKVPVALPRCHSAHMAQFYNPAGQSSARSRGALAHAASAMPFSQPEGCEDFLTTRWYRREQIRLFRPHAFVATVGRAGTGSGCVSAENQKVACIF